MQLYTIGGVPQKYAFESLKKEQIKNSYGDEFLDFFEDIEKNQWLFFSETYTHFLKLNDFEKKEYSLKRFKSGLEAAADVFGFGFEERRKQAKFREKRVLYFCKKLIYKQLRPMAHPCNPLLVLHFLKIEYAHKP